MGALETLQRRKLSVCDFHRMGEAGILHEAALAPAALLQAGIDLTELWRR